MKEVYFTPQTIDTKATRLLATFSSPRRSKSLPDHPALFVLDMQSYFLEPTSHAFVPSAPAILPGLQRLIKHYHSQSWPVIFTRHSNTPDNAGMMAVWWRDLLAADDPLSRIVVELDTSGAIVIDKTQYDAFYHTDLEDLLHRLGVRQVVITGVMTHLCCETTARSAFGRGFEVYFTVDATTSYNEAFHTASLRNLAHGYAYLRRVQDLLQPAPPAGRTD